MDWTAAACNYGVFVLILAISPRTEPLPPTASAAGATWESQTGQADRNEGASGDQGHRLQHDAMAQIHDAEFDPRDNSGFIPRGD